MEIIQVFFTHSTKRKEKILNVTFQELSKVFYRESSKMWTDKWLNNLNSLRKTMFQLGEIWIHIFTRIKFWLRDSRSWK